jgi:large subunit ribosomal protein L9
MKVILQRDVKGMGRAHDAVETKDGYALNYLIPQKLAIPATPAAMKAAEARRARVIDRKELDAKLLVDNIAALADANITIAMKANEKGHLYDAVGAPEISAAAKRDAHIDLPEEAIKLERPLKELGRFEVPVSAGETFGSFSVTIVAA